MKTCFCDFNLSVEVPTKLDTLTEKNRNRDTELKDPLDTIPSLTCKIFLNSAQTCTNVKLNVSCSLPIVAVPDTITYSSIGGVQYEQEVTFYMKTKHMPSSLDVNLCATYSYSVNGATTKLTEHSFRLPLKLLMKSGNQAIGDFQDGNEQRPGNPVSNMKKVVLDSNRSCVNLSEIFPEFSGSFIAANGNILAAQYYGHAHFNVIISGN